jgi:phage-related minor tail protein
LRDKEIELRDYYRGASKARGTWQAHRASAGYSSAARRAGDRAGRRARLGNSPELPGARSALRR